MNNINWNGVLQSITDTWMPLIVMVVAIVVISVVVLMVRKYKNK